MTNGQHVIFHSISPKVLWDAVAGDMVSFRKLMKTFLQIAPPMLERLQQAVQSGDCAAIIKDSHSFKGAVALIGATRLMAMLEDMESRARRAETEGLASGVPEIEQEFVLVVQEAMQSINASQAEIAPVATGDGASS